MTPAGAAAGRTAEQNAFVEFLDRYYHRPDLLVREVWGVEPDAWQDAVMLDVARGERRISIRSGHGVGKTTCLAWIIVWWMLTRFPQKTVCTAPTSAQLFDALANEVKAWLGKLPETLRDLFEVTSERIELKAAPEESFCSFRTSRAETPEALAGVHAPHVLLVPDEASGVPNQVFEAAAGSMSGHSAVTIMAGNPVRTSGLFFDTHHKLRDLWRTYHVSCLDSPRVSPDFAEDMRRRYGERSNAYRVRVLGEFPLADDDTVIPKELVDAALIREVAPSRVREVWGVDCGRFGSDPSALARRQGNALLLTQERYGLDTMQLVGWIKHEYDALPQGERPVEINVDVIGIGAGVVDRGRELGLPVRGINVAESAALNDKYLNLRAELWFKGRDWLAARDCTLSNDSTLGFELLGPKYTYTSSGKLQVESKADMKKRGLPSPNRADAFLLTLATDAVVASGAGGGWGQRVKRIIKGLP